MFIPMHPSEKYKNKYSVSEIKHDRMEKAFADDQSVRPDFLKEETKEIVPAFIAEKKTQEVSRRALRELPCTGLWSALILPLYRQSQSGGAGRADAS